MPGEGIAGDYGKIGTDLIRGSNLAKHHIPHAHYMKTRGISRAEGIAMTVEHPLPGVGGRHREILLSHVLPLSFLRATDVLFNSVINNFVDNNPPKIVLWDQILTDLKNTLLV